MFHSLIRMGLLLYVYKVCATKRDAVKTTKFSQLPDVLVLTLKRFKHELNYSSKVNRCVSARGCGFKHELNYSSKVFGA